MFKVQYRFQKISQNLRKFFFSEIIASELVLLNSPYEEQDTIHGQAMC